MPGTARAAAGPEAEEAAAIGELEPELMRNRYVLNSYSELKIHLRAAVQAEKHRSALPTGPIQASLRAAVQAEKHRSALPTGPIQALSQDTSSRSTSHDREGTGARAG